MSYRKFPRKQGGKTRKQRIVIDKEYHAAMHQLIDDIFALAEEQDPGFKFVDFARQAKLSPSTVSNLNNYRTRFPYMQTIHKMARAVGMKVQLTATEITKPTILKLKKGG